MFFLFSNFLLAPLITSIVHDRGLGSVGEQHSLNCAVIFNGRIVDTDDKDSDMTLITYTWFKDNVLMLQSSMSKYYNISSVQIGDAGEYTCQATATAPYLDITHSVSSNSSDLFAVTGSVTVALLINFCVLAYVCVLQKVTGVILPSFSISCNFSVGTSLGTIHRLDYQS